MRNISRAILEKLSFSETRKDNSVLILWWGSIKGGDVTAGDYMAAINMAAGLARDGIYAEIATYYGFPFSSVNTISPWFANPERYGAVIFVCGPIYPNKRLIRLLKRYQGIPRFAAGVTISKKNIMMLDYFDQVISRDGLEGSLFDLALADPFRKLYKSPIRGRTYVANCYRGQQGDQSPSQRSMHAISETYIHEVLRLISTDNLISIDTRCRQHSLITGILQNFASSKIVLTTRLHGSLLALEHLTPFVAIDQIEGGIRSRRYYANWNGLMSLALIRLLQKNC